MKITLNPNFDFVKAHVSSCEHCRVQLVDTDYKPLSKKFLAPIRHYDSYEQWEEIIKLYFANMDIE